MRPATRSIFDRLRLRPAQMRTVADRRYGDAQALCATGSNARANGAVYLGRFVVECLLKAKLLEKHPWLEAVRSPERHGREEQALWSLFYRSHDLAELLERLPEVSANLAEAEKRGHPGIHSALKSICAEWTVHVRYSPHTVDIGKAKQFLDAVEEVKSWLS